jgi:hypothetical protein
MLKISESVFDKFTLEWTSSFDERAFAFLSDQFPDLLATRGYDGMRRLIIAGHNRASISDCVSEREVMLFLVLQIILGDHFDADPSLSHITAPLRQFDLSGETRLTYVLERLGTQAGQG